MTRTVAEVMTNDPYVVSRNAGVVEAARIMLDRDVGSVPIVENGHLVGIITDRDLAVRVVAAGPDPHTTKVEPAGPSDPHLSMPAQPPCDGPSPLAPCPFPPPS